MLVRAMSVLGLNLLDLNRVDLRLVEWDRRLAAGGGLIRSLGAGPLGGLLMLDRFLMLSSRNGTGGRPWGAHRCDAGRPALRPNVRRWGRRPSPGTLGFSVTGGFSALGVGRRGGRSRAAKGWRARWASIVYALRCRPGRPFAMTLGHGPRL